MLDRFCIGCCTADGKLGRMIAGLADIVLAFGWAMPCGNDCFKLPCDPIEAKCEAVVCGGRCIDACGPLLSLGGGRDKFGVLEPDCVVRLNEGFAGGWPGLCGFWCVVIFRFGLLECAALFILCCSGGACLDAGD